MELVLFGSYWFMRTKKEVQTSAITQNLLNSTLSAYSFTTVALNVQNVNFFFIPNEVLQALYRVIK